MDARQKEAVVIFLPFSINWNNAMSDRTLSLDETLYQYLLDVSLREHPVLVELRAP
ncbi:hypothetical protein ACFS07_01275 [Undibacterium arcticum]